MKELIEKIKLLQDAEAAKVKFAEAIKELNKNIETLSAEIAQYFIDNMIQGKLTLDGKEVEAVFENNYSILGGEMKAPEKKLRLLSELAALGYADKIKFYETGAINERDWKSIMKKVDAAKIKEWKDAGLLSVWMTPKVRIK